MLSCLKFRTTLQLPVVTQDQRAYGRVDNRLSLPTGNMEVMSNPFCVDVCRDSNCPKRPAARPKEAVSASTIQSPKPGARSVSNWFSQCQECTYRQGLSLFWELAQILCSDASYYPNPSFERKVDGKPNSNEKTASLGPWKARMAFIANQAIPQRSRPPPKAVRVDESSRRDGAERKPCPPIPQNPICVQ